VPTASARAFGGPQQERQSLAELLDDLEQHYRVERRASLPQLRSHVKHLRRFFDGWRAMAVDAAAVRDFIEQRRADGAAEASIARELEALRRAFTLAAAAGRLGFTPVLPTLAIGHRNARQGFVAKADFQALLEVIGDSDVRDFAEWAWWSGMRKGEIAKLRWEYLDRDAWTLAIPASDTKTRRPRTLALEGPLRDVMRRRLGARVFECPFIFHRDGAAISEFRKTWAAACWRAGLAGLLFHDLRRSAVRNMVRAGVDPAVAMRVSGHRTRAVFDRYNIVSEDDLRAAAQRTADYVASQPSERSVASIDGRRAQRRP
jgi:integrase